MGNSYHPAETQDHLLESRLVAQTYRITVLVPMRRGDGSERFPVIYATDRDDLWGGLATIANSVQLLGEAPRFILVGIGYEPAGAAAVLRWRDFGTHDIRARFEKELRQVADSPLVTGLADFDLVTRTTDANDFLRFIREELQPFINHRYPTLPDDSNYFGYSAGGTFGLHVLFTQPHVFKRYILGSPGTSYCGDQFALELVERFRKTGASLQAKLFMSVGELEEFNRGLGQFDLVSGFIALAKCLQSKPLPGLDLTLRMFPQETHATAWAPAFSHGLRALLGSVDQVPYWPDYFK